MWNYDMESRSGRRHRPGIVPPMTGRARAATGHACRQAACVISASPVTGAFRCRYFAE
jgi:hypothetical protein